MTTQQQALTHCDSTSPAAMFGIMARFVREALARTLARRRLAQELSQLDDRELADLYLQRHDIDRLARGLPVPALAFWRRPR